MFLLQLQKHYLTSRIINAIVGLIIPGHMQNILHNALIIITVFRTFYCSINYCLDGHRASHRIFRLVSLISLWRDIQK